MNDLDMNIAIAEICGYECHGWECHQMSYWTDPVGRVCGVPPYTSSLDAMLEAKTFLTADERVDYIRHLNRGDFSFRTLAFSDAKEQAMAFLKAKGKL